MYIHPAILHGKEDQVGPKALLDLSQVVEPQQPCRTGAGHPNSFPQAASGIFHYPGDAISYGLHCSCQYVLIGEFDHLFGKQVRMSVLYVLPQRKSGRTLAPGRSVGRGTATR